MKNSLKRLLAVILSLVMLTGCVVTAYADTGVAGIIAGLMGGNAGSINLADAFATWLNGQINDDSAIDSFVDNIKNEFMGTGDSTPDDPDAPDEEVIIIDKAEASNIAELYNLTVNELKKGNPAFVKTQTASMGAEISKQLQGGLGVVTGLVEGLIGTKDIFASVIDGTNKEAQVRTSYSAGNDVINNLPVSGKDYVACLTADDIKDYTITIYRSGAYRMHIDLVDVEGSAAQSGLAHAFDTTDKAFATIELGTTSINTQVKLHYIDNYVECVVDRDGQITSFTTNMGITFLFMQEDGSYSSEMPYMGVDFREEGVVYNINTEYTGIDFSLRKMGDADENGKINSSDARKVLRAASGLEPLNEDAVPYCDVTRDGKISAGDAREILRAASSLTTLPTTTEALGFREYEKSERTQKMVDDLLIILMAYQSAKDEATREEIQDYYDDMFNGNGNKEEEPTTGEINSTGGKVEDVIGGIGGIIGGITDGSFDFGSIFG